MNAPSFKAACSLLLGTALMACAQEQPAYTELSPPEGITGFAWEFGSLSDLTRDGVDEFYVLSNEQLHVYDGATAKLHYTLQTPCASRGFGVGRSAGDLTGDGIPEIMANHPCVLGGQVSFFNGANGEVLYTITSPDPVSLGLFGATLRVLPDMNRDGKEDWLIHQPENQSRTGRAYIFESATRSVIRTIRNTGTGFTFHMMAIEVIPDVDGDRKPELVIGGHSANVIRDGQTINGAGRVIVRSLQTGEVLYELMDPEPQDTGGFGLVVTGIGDITNDKIGDIAVGTHFKDNGTGAIYLFNGADGRWLRTVRSPNRQSNGRFGRKIEVLPDLNGDSVPELGTQEDGLGLAYVYDGATSVLLKTIEYPGPVGPFFLIGTIRQQAAPGIRAYLFDSPFADGSSGRVYYLPFTPIQPTRLKTLGKTASGFHLQVTGEPGRKLEIQATSDFKTWGSVTSVTTGADPIDLEDSAAASHSQRFYRTVQRE